MSVVTENLKRRGIGFELIPHAQTYTSIDEARALGISADEVVKTVVLDTRAGHAFAVIPAGRRLDMKLVREAVDDHHARLADERELERDFEGWELGAFPPIGSIHAVSVLVDPEVLRHETVVFSAGSRTESVKARPEELFKAERVTIVPLTVHPDDSAPALD